MTSPIRMLSWVFFSFLAHFLTQQLLIFPTKPNFLGTEQIFIECYKLHWHIYLKSSFVSTAIWVSKIAGDKTQGASGSLDTDTIKRALTIAVNVLRRERNLNFQTAPCNCKKDFIGGFYKYSCIYSMFTSSTNETCPSFWNFFFNFPLIDVKRHKASMNDEVVISSITSMWTPWHNRHANNTAHYLEFAEPPRVQRTTASKGPKQSTPT